MVAIKVGDKHSFSKVLSELVANHWDAVANQFKEEEDITPQPSAPAWLNRQADELVDTQSIGFAIGIANGRTRR
jgi:hypothetical protein